MMPPPALGPGSPGPALELADVIRRHGGRLGGIPGDQQRQRPVKLWLPGGAYRVGSGTRNCPHTGRAHADPQSDIIAPTSRNYQITPKYLAAHSAES